MEQHLKKKALGTSVFALIIAAFAFGLLGFVQAKSANANPNAPGQNKGHAYGHGGKPETPPPGQVGNEHSNRGGTPGNGRGK